MEQQIGYSIVDQANTEIQFWNQSNIPNPIILPGNLHVHAPSINTNYNGYQLVERWQVSDETPGLVQTGQTISYDGTRILVTLQYRNPDQSELLAYSASVRYKQETSGITVGTDFIWTDRQSQAMINGIITLMQVDPNTVISFKTGNGFIQANAAVMTNIATAVASHIQTCFSTEANVAVGIQSDTVTTFAQVDNGYGNV